MTTPPKMSVVKVHSSEVPRLLATPHDGLGVVDRGLGLAGKLLAAEILDDAGIGRRKARGTR